MTTQTTSLRLILPVQGEFSGTWGDQVNAGITNLVDSAVAGMAAVSVTTANQALTANNYTADQARAAILKLTTTTTAAFAVYIPPATKAYTVYNASAYSATIYCSTVLGNTTAAGTGVAIPAGATTQVNSDGTNVLSSVTYLPSINSTPIGATTASTGAFTTLSASGNVIVSPGSTVYADAFSANTGGIKVALSGSTGVNLKAGSTTIAEISSTGLAVTGALSVAAPGNSISLSSLSSSTAYNTSQITNSGGSLYLGVDNSTGTAFNSSAYGGVVGTGNATNLALMTNGAVKATLDTAGNLGLGVTPSAWNSSLKALQIQTTGIAANHGAWANFSFNTYYDAGGYKYQGTGGTAPALLYQQSGTGTVGHLWYVAGNGTAGNPITFTQAMTLDANGNLLVGAASSAVWSSGGVVVSPSFDRTMSSGVGVGHSTNGVNGDRYLSLTYNGSQIGSITQSGTTAVAYNTTSDHRLKENVRDANAARFMGIQFRDFEWTDGRHDCGVIAHELQAIYPDLVLGEKDATEVRQIEITPAVPAVTEQVQVSPAVEAVEAVLDDEGAVLQEAIPAIAAVYETVEVAPAIAAVTEDQTFPVYQQVNYTGLIGRMGTRVQQLQRTVDSQAALIDSLILRLTALEQK